MGTIINRKIIEFGAQHELNIVAKRRREGRHLTGIAYYNIYTRDGVHLGRISAEYSYEQFLEKIAINAISEAQITLLSDKIKEEEDDCRVGNACLLQMSLNQYEDDLSELRQIMEAQRDE